jgi:uncharacterized protein with HEPN domain
MKLIVIGEAVKNIDRRTDKALLLKYSDTEWKEIMKLRDIIVHHYANVDAERIFAIISNDIGPLLETVKKIKNDLLKQ